MYTRLWYDCRITVHEAMAMQRSKDVDNNNNNKSVKNKCAKPATDTCSTKCILRIGGHTFCQQSTTATMWRHNLTKKKKKLCKSSLHCIFIWLHTYVCMFVCTCVYFLVVNCNSSVYTVMQRATQTHLSTTTSYELRLHALTDKHSSFWHSRKLNNG